MTQTEKTSLFESILTHIVGARVVILFLFHAIVFVAAYALAYLLRFDFAIPPEFVVRFKSSLPLVVGIQLLVGVPFGYYRGWWRYVGVVDVVKMAIGLTTTLALLVAGWYVGAAIGLEDRFVKSPRAVLLTDWAFALLALFAVRLFIRVGRDRFRAEGAVPDSYRNVLIIGAGDAGETLAREIQHRPQMGMRVVGFVDDQRAKIGSNIRGIRVSGPIAEVAKIADEADAREALIAIPSASGKRLREIIRQLSEADLAFKTMPGIDQIVNGRVHLTQLRPVNVEDLLRRERIELPGDPVQALFRGKRVMITGAGGTIGSELASQILQLAPERLALVERSEYALYEVRKRLSREAGYSTSTMTCNLVDIGDSAVVEELLGRERPEVVLHAAAHKHVPLGEQNPPEYLRNNAIATRDLADLCIRHGVDRFVLISTDKAINPTSVMGATKRAAEILLLDAVRSNQMKATIVRFGNVIGSSGSVIPLFMEQIAAGGPVTVTHPEVTRYFIRTSEAISLVLQAATLGDLGQVLMLDMGEPIRIADLARDLIRLSNHTEDEIPIVFTGLRDGEKMFEEIRLTGESVRPTVHPQIVVTETQQIPRDAVARWLSRSRMLTSAEEVVQHLAEMIPEYVRVAKVAGAAEAREGAQISASLAGAT